MIIKITPDKEKAKSLLETASDREEIVKQLKEDKFPSNILENFYEASRELITSLMLINGFKTTGENAHRETIQYLKKYKEFSSDELLLLDDLRLKRNKFMYEGKKISSLYLESNKSKIKVIIERLKTLVTEKLRG